MCSIEEAWAGQTFGGKPVVSQSDIHKSYMSLPDDIMTHNNEFNMKTNNDKNTREFTRDINSKYSRTPRVPKINRNSNNANINISSSMPSYNNYNGITPRPPYMEIYDNAEPVPVMSNDKFTDIENAYDVSSTVNNFMKNGMVQESDMNNLLDEDTYEEQNIINNKFTNKQNQNNFTNIKKLNKYNSSNKNNSNDNSNDNLNDNSNDNSTSISSGETQIILILQQLITKLDKLERELHNSQTRNMYDIILYILIGILVAFIIYSMCKK